MQYTPSDSTQFSDQELKRAEWWVEHKGHVMRAVEIVVGVIGGVLLLYGVYGYADWFFGTGPLERANLAQQSFSYIDYATFREQNMPRPLQLDTTIVLQSGDALYDFAARVENPNRMWWASFDYAFSAAPNARTHRGYIMPLDGTFMTDLGVQSDSRPAAGGIEITNLEWHRVDWHETQPSYDAWVNARLTLDITDPAFTLPAADDAVQVRRATFTVTNSGGFSYQNVPFVVTLYSGTRIVGMQRVTISSVRAGEIRTVDASWYTDLPTVTRIDVKPDLNLFDAGQYIGAGQ